MVLLAEAVEPCEEILVGCPVGQGFGGERLVGAFDGFAFGFGVGAGVDLGGGHVGVTEQVAYVDQVDSGLETGASPGSVG